MDPLEVRVTADGRVQARRSDGRPLTRADRQEAKLLAQLKRSDTAAEVIEEYWNAAGRLRAVLIASPILNDRVVVIFDRTYSSAVPMAFYFADELAALAPKSVETLREIHKTKLVFPGAKVNPMTQGSGTQEFRHRLRGNDRGICLDFEAPYPLIIILK